MSKQSSKRLREAGDGKFGINLALYNYLSLNGRVYVPQDDLRKALLDPQILSCVMDRVKESGAKASSFRTRVAGFSSSTKKREQKKTMVRCTSIGPQNALSYIGEEDQMYLSWFMRNRNPSQYEFLLVEKSALDTQSAIIFYQSKYDCLDEHGKPWGEDWCVVFSHLIQSDRCVVVIHSDRLDALRVVALPHIHRKCMMPLHPLYIERLTRASGTVNAQWRYRYTVKSLLVYLSMMVSKKWKPTIASIASMGSDAFNVYSMLPRVMSMWKSEVEIQTLVKDAYLKPNSQYNFTRALKAFIMQDAKHWIHKDVFDVLYGMICTYRNEFPVQQQIMDTIHRQGNVIGRKWIEITPYKKGVTRGRNEFVPSRIRTVLVDERGSELNPDIPFHTWLYQLILSDKLTLELRRNIFLGMSLDKDGGCEDDRVSPLKGASLWKTFFTDTLNGAPYETCLVPSQTTSIQVKEAHEMVSLLSVLSGLEFASRMKTKEIKRTEDLSGCLKPRLKHILTGAVDFPVAWNEDISTGKPKGEDTPVYFQSSFPSVEFRMDLEQSSSVTSSNLTQEFVEFHYLHRNPAYYEFRTKFATAHSSAHKRARQEAIEHHQE